MKEKNILDFIRYLFISLLLLELYIKKGAYLNG